MGFFTPPRKNNVGPLRAGLMLVSDVTPPISDRPRHAEYEGKYALYEGKYALLLAERGYFDLGADQTLQRVAGRAMREVNTVSKEKTDGDGRRGSWGVRDNGSPVQDNGTRCRWKGVLWSILTALGVLRASAGKGRGRGGSA